jgi:hypothetical protein
MWEVGETCFDAVFLLVLHFFSPLDSHLSTSFPLSQCLTLNRSKLCELLMMGPWPRRTKLLRYILTRQGPLLSPKETLPVLGSFIPTYSCFTLLSPVTGSQVLVLIAVSILIFNKELIQVPKIDLSLNSTT